MTTAAVQPDAAPPVRSTFASAALTLWHRELVRFFRQRNRVISALATPIVFWLLLGSGLNRSFMVRPEAGGQAGEGIGYLAYFFPGALVLILLFTAIFSTISVIEDRREGFLQGVLLAAAPRLAIAMGKILGGASIATIQGTLFLLVWPLVGGFPGFGAALAALVLMFVLAIALTALGLCIAWPMDSTAGFHAIMNLFLMPMWFLSGAVFPVTEAPIWLRVVMYSNPLTYGHTLLATTLHGGNAAGAAVSVPVAAGLLVLSGLALVVLAGYMVQRPRRAGA